MEESWRTFWLVMPLSEMNFLPSLRLSRILFLLNVSSVIWSLFSLVAFLPSRAFWLRRTTMVLLKTCALLMVPFFLFPSISMFLRRKLRLPRSSPVPELLFVTLETTLLLLLSLLRMSTDPTRRRRPSWSSEVIPSTLLSSTSTTLLRSFTLVVSSRPLTDWTTTTMSVLETPLLSSDPSFLSLAGRESLPSRPETLCTEPIVSWLSELPALRG